MKGQGIFRRVIDRTKRAFGLPVTHRYADPAFLDPRTRQKKRAHGHVSSGRFRHTRELAPKAPPCIPGTIAYQDKLTRHFGHKVANDFRRHYIKAKRTPGMDVVVPSEQDFIDNPPWEHLRG